MNSCFLVTRINKTKESNVVVAELSSFEDCGIRLKVFLLTKAQLQSKKVCNGVLV